MKLTGNKNQCQGCKLYFKSVRAFDKHRTGRHGIDRRCMAVDEMSQAGMFVNDNGWWVSEKMPSKVLAEITNSS